MSSDVIITVSSLIVPAMVVLTISFRFWGVLDRVHLYDLFVRVFTIFSAVVVLAGAASPRVFDAIGDNKAFLIVVSLSAVLHGITDVAKVIDKTRSRSRRRSSSSST